MKKVKYTGWINIFRNIKDGSFFIGEEVFKTKAEAIEEWDLLLDIYTDPTDTIKITWKGDSKENKHKSVWKYVILAGLSLLLLLVSCMVYWVF